MAAAVEEAEGDEIVGGAGHVGARRIACGQLIGRLCQVVRSTTLWVSSVAGFQELVMSVRLTNESLVRGADPLGEHAAVRVAVVRADHAYAPDEDPHFRFVEVHPLGGVEDQFLGGAQ